MDIYSSYPRRARRAGVARDAFGTRQFGDFKCCQCGLAVSADPLHAGVQHRNHCPYCLWSRHVDLAATGDRLCACKGPMPPVGLCFKRRQKKYASQRPGELMLVHRCQLCGAVSLNRVAADDNPAALWAVYESALAAPVALPGIDLPDAEQGARLRERLLACLG